jgi:arginyl-tRNA synthetase
MDVALLLKESLQKVFEAEYDLSLNMSEIHMEHPNAESWGDYASNVCMMVSKQLDQSPMEIAKNVSYRVLTQLDLLTKSDEDVSPVEKVTFEAPGFINFTLSHNWLLGQLKTRTYNTDNPAEDNNIGRFRANKVLFEYTDPNPFKVFHIGHLMSNAIGESLSRLYEFSGAQLRRVNYQGDVGMHVAKSVWGFIKKMETDQVTLEDLEQKTLKERVTFMGEAYALGASEFKKDPEVQKEMQDLNAQLFVIAQDMLIESKDWKPIVDYKKFVPDQTKYDISFVKDIYLKGRAWSLADFEDFYVKLGTKFDDYYFESLVGEYGWQLVSQYLKEGIFEENQGAVIFNGDSFGLHNRVFLNSHGLPTYEAKDLGLALLKFEDFNYDLSFIVTANEVNEYFKVVLKALSQFNPDIAKKTNHIGHGMMVLPSGKMSSRTGEVVTGMSLMRETQDMLLEKIEAGDSNLTSEEKELISSQLAVGAIKYSILKHGIGKNIVYEKDKSVEVTGDTGIYLQYTHARAASVLNGAPEWEYDYSTILYNLKEKTLQLEQKEISLLRHLQKFDDNVNLAVDNFAPSTLCTYLFELAQHFNTFYNDLSILSAETEMQRNLRLQLTKQVKDILVVGLWLLGIEAPERV